LLSGEINDIWPNLLSLDISFTFKKLMKFPFSATSGLLLSTVMFFAAVIAVGQTKPAPREIFRDSDGNLVSNNEFVDIRVANFNYPDATVIKILEDGTKEFRLQKIPQEGMPAPAFTFARSMAGHCRSQTCEEKSSFSVFGSSDARPV
jgi:hypothetical protein